MGRRPPEIYGRDDFGELALGTAFNYVIENEHKDFIQVPGHLQKQVHRYIECLTAADMEDRKGAA